MIADEATLARLMAAAQRGDGDAYRALLQESAAWLGRYFRRKLPRGQVDDLVQDVLLSLHSKRATYDPRLPFLPWLAAIARYRWVDHLRRIYREQAQVDETAELAEIGGQDAAIARLSLDGLFARLPKAQAHAIELVKIEGKTIREAANCCRQSESLVKINIHRGLKRLATMIEEAD